MKILYHHRTLGDGAEGIHIAEMVNAFRELGHEVKVISLIGSKTNVNNPKTKFWEAIRKRVPEFVYELMEIFHNVIGYVYMSESIEEFKPDFVYKRHSNYDLFPILACRRKKVPIILEVNCPHWWVAHKKFEPLYFPWLAKIFEMWIFSKVDKNVVVSTPIKECLVQMDVSEDKIMVMPNGANFEKFNPSIDGSQVRKKYGIDGNTILGWVGILRQWHGVELLLETLNEIYLEQQNLHLLLVGDGPHRDYLENFVQKNFMDNYVTFTGRVPHDDVAYHVAAMDITITAADMTGFASPMKILEYMAMGKPVIAPRMKNIEDIIIDGKDGILFEPGNKEELKKAILQLLRDDFLRIEIRSNAREKIVSEYNWINNAEKILEIYNQKINNNS